MGRTVAIKDLQNGDWEYYVSTNERDARLKPGTANGARFSEEEAQFFVYDHLGNTRITYTPMQVAGTYTINRIDYVADYFPYGKKMPGRSYFSSSYEGYRYQFTGHEQDGETGYQYHGARYYNEELGKYMSVDPLAVQAVNWSTYRYCFDNPVIYVDPTGRFETRKEAKEYKKEHDIWGTVRKDSDGGFNISNRKNGTSYRKATGEEMDDNLSRPFINKDGVIIEAFTNGRGGRTTNESSQVMNYLQTTNDIFGASSLGMGVKTELLEWTVRANYKSNNTRQGWEALRETQKAWRTTNTFGKTGAKYLKATKALGVAGEAVGVLTATYQLANDPTAGNATRLAVQAIAVGASFIPVVGWGISLGIGVADMIWGEELYQWIDKK